ncbi:hypothetical protein GN958_ATG00405 [Phytophthora infestans]|uniref:Uncharacterized protein n=1 Tax=Phytophthora infestans TaxID=4787 RepID=A0A8S9VE10_PHYIN|nr:hypothetical protein GN958_ATG00405 [Phytophthora infestans]
MFTTKLGRVEELGFFFELHVVEGGNHIECKNCSDDLGFGVESTSSPNWSFFDDSVFDHVQRYTEDFGCSGNAKSAKTNLCRASDFHGVVQRRFGVLGYILGEKCADDLYCGRHHECAADLGLDCDMNETYPSDVTYVAKLRCPESLRFACVRGCAEISQCSGALTARR